MITSEIFERDVVSNNINVIPLVVFDKGGVITAVSTNNISFKDENNDTLYFAPLLLNIPSIRESVDVDNRNFKISNLTLSISNVEYAGMPRFSDGIADLINAECIIYWKTQSAQNITDCLLVFRGKVRNVSHTDTNVTVLVEDVSQENLHKTIPIASVTTDLELLDKYKNEPIPICYGEVNNARLVLTPADDGTNNIGALPDDVSQNIIFGYKDRDRAIAINHLGQYMAIKPDTVYEDNHIYSNQYIVENNNAISLMRIVEENEDGESFTNTITNGLAEVEFTDASEYTMSQYVTPPPISGGINIIEGNYEYVDGDIHTIGLDEGLSFHSVTRYTYNTWLYTLCKIFNKAIPTTGDDFKTLKNFVHFLGIFEKISSNQSETLPNPKLTIVIPRTPSFDWYEWFYNADDVIKINAINEYTIADIEGIYAYWHGFNPFLSTGEFSELTAKIKIHNYDLITHGTVSNIFRKDMITNLYGRVGIVDTHYKTELQRYSSLNITGELIGSTDGDDMFIIQYDLRPDADTVIPHSSSLYPVYFNIDGDYLKLWVTGITRFEDGFGDWDGQDIWVVTFGSSGEVEGDSGLLNSGDSYPDIEILFGNSYIEMPCDIIYHLLDVELGYSGIVNEVELNESRLEHIGWVFSINQKKEISSKKLIENIAKQSKSFPKFRNDGTFGYNTVKDVYSDSDVDIVIHENDIIDFKITRTKLEQIKTKIRILYGWDNITEKHLNSTEYITAGELYDYDMNYYGLDEDHNKSILEVKSDYIQNDETALRLRNWLISWHCNQHNIIEMVLPLRFLTMEIGDIIKFETMISKMKLYGEDYTVENIRNGQVIYPYFMIIEINKTIDKITVKILQLHNHNDVWDYESEITPATVGAGDMILEQVNNVIE